MPPVAERIDRLCWHQAGSALFCETVFFVTGDNISYCVGFSYEIFKNTGGPGETC